MTENEDTRERLLEAAGQVFAEKGFKSATVREICGKVGANVAAVNYHFGDKERLYIAAVQFAHCKWMPVSPDPGLPPDRQLHVFIREFLAHLLDPNRPAWHAQLMLRELAEPTQACVEWVNAYIRPFAERLHNILVLLAPQEIPQEVRMRIGFSIVGQCLFYKVQRPIAMLLVGAEAFESFTVDVLADHITRFTLSALGHGSFLNKPGAPS